MTVTFKSNPAPQSNADRVAELEAELVRLRTAVAQLKIESSYHDENAIYEAECRRLRGWEHMGS